MKNLTATICLMVSGLESAEYEKRPLWGKKLTNARIISLWSARRSIWERASGRNN
jgi:hypothetical protein